eukprot:1747493-Pyramimonas_sp.AAC.1
MYGVALAWPSMGCLGASHDPLGVNFGRHTGSLWGVLGGVVGLLGSLRGAFWGALGWPRGASWGPLGSLRQS